MQPQKRGLARSALTVSLAGKGHQIRPTNWYEKGNQPLKSSIGPNRCHHNDDRRVGDRSADGAGGRGDAGHIGVWVAFYSSSVGHVASAVATLASLVESSPVVDSAKQTSARTADLEEECASTAEVKVVAEVQRFAKTVEAEVVEVLGAGEAVIAYAANCLWGQTDMASRMDMLMR